jgi:hypothetical protein
MAEAMLIHEEGSVTATYGDAFDEIDEQLEGNEDMCSSSEEEDAVESMGHHTYLKVTEDGMRITFNGVKSKLLTNAKECIKLTLQKARSKLGFTRAAHLTPSYNQILNLFFTRDFLNKLTDAINRAFTLEEKMSLLDLEQCLRLLFLMHYYTSSPERVLQNECGLYAYPFSKEDDRALFKKFIKGLSFSPHAQSYETAWGSAQSCDHTINRAAQSKKLWIVLYVFVITNIFLS